MISAALASLSALSDSDVTRAVHSQSLFVTEGRESPRASQSNRFNETDNYGKS